MVPEEAMVGHLDDMLQLPGLLLHLCRQEEGGRRDGMAVEACEGVKHVEAVHVHDGGVDRQLVTVEAELRKVWAWWIVRETMKTCMYSEAGGRKLRKSREKKS